MAFYIVKFNGKNYANEDLFGSVVAGGERAFIKMLGRKEVFGQIVFDQVLYPLTQEQEELCRKQIVTAQDFDAFYGNLNRISPSTLAQVKENKCPWLKNATVITVGANMSPELFKHRNTIFIKAELHKGTSHTLTKMAATKLCGRYYIALNAVDIRIERPIIVTI